MSEPLQFQPDDARAHDPELPYRLELREGDGRGVVLAVCSSPGVAYAVYYAALREYLSRRITLSLAGRVLASTGRD